MLPTNLRRTGRGDSPFDAIQDQFNRALSQWWGDGGNQTTTGIYPVDIREDADHIYVEAELPGFKKDEIERRIQKIDGIRSMQSEIAVLPISPADDDLRYRVAHAIYNHPVFWVYAQMPVPPIHIVVERGRITLTGAAESEVQRSLATSLAQVSGSFGVTNRIRVEKR